MMKPHYFVSLLGVAVFLVAACEPPAQHADMAQVKSEIQTIENAWAAALNERDVDALMALYADDAQSLPSNAPVLDGKAAIKAAQEAAFKTTPAGRTYSFETLSVVGTSDIVTETGLSTYKDAEGNITGTGKYIAVFEKQNGQYRCIREVYNNDQAPAAAGSKSIHLFDMPEGITEAEWSASLKKVNDVIEGLGYPGAGYYFYKTEDEATENYRYYFEGVWPSAEAYTKIHEDPAYIAATDQMGTLYAQIKAVQMYRRLVSVK